MAPLSQSELKQLIAIMQDMQHFASESNWQELSRLDSERRALLRYDSAALAEQNRTTPAQPLENTVVTGLDSMSDCLSETSHAPLDNHGSTEHATLVDEVRRLDKLIITIVQTARDKLLAENRELSAQVKAKAVYAQTSRIG